LYYAPARIIGPCIAVYSDWSSAITKSFIRGHGAPSAAGDRIGVDRGYNRIRRPAKNAFSFSFSASAAEDEDGAGNQ